MTATEASDGMPSTEPVKAIVLAPGLRLMVRRRTDSSLDLRLARGAPPAEPYRLTQAGFRLPLNRVQELRAVLRDLAEL